jgi:hypothetical protein
MNNARPRLAFRWLISAFLLFVATGTAYANYNYMELLRRVPDSANTLIMIDVERMLMSPIAMKEKWRDKANSSDGEPLHFPVNAERYMLASKVDYVSSFDDVWDAALIETTSDISLPYLSKMEGGYLDTVEGQQVAFSPRNAFLVLFKPRILGLSFPANKQDLARWLRKTQRRDEPQVSDYLQNAVTLAHGKDHIVAAFDLGDMFTSRQVRARLQRAESLAGKEVDLNGLTKLITSLKGVTFTVEATDRLNGTMRVDFGESPSQFKEVAKALMFEALETNGMMLDDGIKDWALAVEAKALTLRGRLSRKGLRMLTNLIPFPAETLDLSQASPKPGETGAETPGSASTADSTATVSKKYFQHISLLIDELRTDVNNAGSAKLARRMIDKAALEIDRLPVLNVDEDLIGYGAGVSETFRNMRNMSKYASLDANYRQASLAGNQGYGYGGFYGGGTNVSVSTSVMRKQESAALAANELAVFTLLQQKTAEIRKKMTLKYKVEF